MAVVRRVVTLDSSKHHLRPETMVCAEQASRLRSTVELPFKLQVAMTTEMYEQKHGRSAPPAHDGRSDSAECAASTARRGDATLLVALPHAEMPAFPLWLHRRPRPTVRRRLWCSLSGTRRRLPGQSSDTADMAAILVLLLRRPLWWHRDTRHRRSQTS